jgi:hypothetical protein
MTSEDEVRELVDAARAAGAIIRTKTSAGRIEAVSIGKAPGGEYRKLGEPGAGWLPVVAAAERLREIVTAANA